MRSTTSLRSLSTLGSAIICVAASSTQAQTNPPDSLSVDMPHGGCRLIARQDGTASTSFGAMPKFAHVGAGALNFEQLAKELREKSYPQSDTSPTGVAIGSVSLPASKDLLLIHDEAFVKALLQRAWNARVLPSTRREIEDYDWVARMCSFQ